MAHLTAASVVPIKSDGQTKMDIWRRRRQIATLTLICFVFIGYSTLLETQRHKKSLQNRANGLEQAQDGLQRATYDADSRTEFIGESTLSKDGETATLLETQRHKKSLQNRANGLEQAQDGLHRATYDADSRTEFIGESTLSKDGETATLLETQWHKKSLQNRANGLEQAQDGVQRATYDAVSRTEFIGESTLSKDGETGPSTFDVVLNSYMRGGSTLTGIVLGLRDDSFYLYEPLIKYIQWAYFYGKNTICHAGRKECWSLDSNATAEVVSKFKLKRLSFAQKLLSDIYDCHFDEYINLISNIHFIKGGHVWSQVGACYKSSANKTKEHKACCIKQRIPDTCKNSTHRVTKVLRMTVDNLEYLLKTRKNMKIIHLFRDPRAIINSRIKTSWYPRMDLISNAEGLCHKMLYDFYEGQKLYSRYPERFRFIYYEDLNDRPLDKVKSLYKYLGMSLDKSKYSVVESISVFNSNKTQAEKERETNTAYWWRRSLDWSLLQRIDEKCAGVYKALGYKKFDTYADLTNLSVDSVVIPEQYKI